MISDYDKGFLDENEIKYLTKLHNLVFLDTKKKLDDWALGVEIIKINYNEYLKNIDWLEDEFKGDLIVTKGSEGAILNHDTEFKIETEHPVRDLSGAGDTFLAALVVEYLKKNNVKNAIKFANKCASWVVTQKGVVAVNPQMI